MMEIMEQRLRASPPTQQSQSPARTVPMKVLCLGYGRTGTRSLREALLILGFHHTYHTFDAVYVNPYDCKLWLDALRAKFDGVGKPPGREQFDQLLGHCQAVVDMPAAAFAPELIRAYPEAKVILTNRNIDEWQRSVRNTLQVADSSLISLVLGYTAKLLRMPNRWNYPMFQKLSEVLYDKDFERNSRRSFEKHYDHVRSLVPKDKLLEYHISEGWEPLCKFLDKPIPSEETPFINQTAGFEKKFRDRNIANIKAQLKRALQLALYVLLAVMLLRMSTNMWLAVKEL